jgi:hypothetical protein
MAEKNTAVVQRHGAERGRRVSNTYITLLSLKEPSPTPIHSVQQPVKEDKAGL